MKSVVFSLAVAGFVAAQDLSNMPQCAINCISEILPEVGCSGPEDFACACQNIEEVITSGTECFATNCETAELLQAQDAAVEACSSVVSSIISSATETSPTFSSVDPEPPASTTVIGIITPDPSPTISITIPTPTLSLTSTPSLTTPSTSTSTDDPSSTESDDPSGTEETGGSPTESDPEGGVAKPLAGAGLALLAAIAAL